MSPAADDADGASASHVTWPDLGPFEPGAIRAVAFDAYGTLFQWDFRNEIRRVLEMQRLDAEHEAVAKSFEEAWNRVSPWAEHIGDDGKPDRRQMLAGPVPEWIPMHEVWRRQFAETFAEHNLDGDTVAGADHLRDVLSSACAYPDAQATVESLAGSGLRLGLLSNADEDFLQSAVSANRLRFSVIQSSESLRVYKPNRAAFDELVRRLGCAPSEVLYVGDSAPSDVAGARHAGLRVAWLRRSEEYEFPDDIPRPDLELRELAELTHALDTPTRARRR